MRSGPLQQYSHLITKGSIQSNHNQFLAIQALEELHSTILGYSIQPIKKTFFGSLFKNKTVGPRGLYMYGGVGSGKSMLMDLFYSTCPTQSKQRTHFHQFMQSLHQRVHELRKVKVDDPIPVLATEIAKKSWLLCFDEFQVTDIADAMLLRRLCAELFEQGVVMVATSNRHPNDLYLNGIQRKEFLPTIELVKERLKVFHLDAGLDYRKTEKKKVQVFSFSGTADSLDLLWKKLTKEKPIEQKILHIWGRELVMEQSCGRMALTDFDSLCAKPHSAADYLALCEHYDVLLIRNIPKLNLDSRNEARRLITLIDAVYDSRIKLLCHFQMDNLDQLFTASSKSTFDTAKQDQVKGSQHDEVFAFDRTKSRLIEMQNAQWLGDHYTSLIN